MEYRSMPRNFSAFPTVSLKIPECKNRRPLNIKIIDSCILVAEIGWLSTSTPVDRSLNWNYHCRISFQAFRRSEMGRKLVGNTYQSWKTRFRVIKPELSSRFKQLSKKKLICESVPSNFYLWTQSCKFRGQWEITQIPRAVKHILLRTFRVGCIKFDFFMRRLFCDVALYECEIIQICTVLSIPIHCAIITAGGRGPDSFSSFEID